ncbi:MAG: polysaccharide pyruvyl transferase family protein [Lentisphaeria bacterium]
MLLFRKLQDHFKKPLERFVNSRIDSPIVPMRKMMNTQFCIEQSRKINALSCMKVSRLVKVHFVFRMGAQNAGDDACCPYQYFSDLFSAYHCYFHTIPDVDYACIQKGDIVICGGGGLIDLFPDWNACVERLYEITGNVIIWGAGLNSEKREGKIIRSLNLSNMSLVGLRDFGLPFDFVPCPSCMLPELSYSYPKYREIGIVQHVAYPIDDLSYERITNNVDIYTMLNFIGTSAVIVTNSYHAIYWATLMGKKVIIYNTFSTKFDNIRWKHPLYSGNLSEDILKCDVYKDVLNDCRMRNYAFAKKVKTYIDGM